jgi:hypothetical protein
MRRIGDGMRHDNSQLIQAEDRPSLSGGYDLHCVFCGVAGLFAGTSA